jgi:Rad9
MSNSVSFSATNASLSAYCRFTYDRSFFTKFNLRDRNTRDDIPDLDDMEQVHTVTGQLYVQVFPLRMKSAFSRSLCIVIASTRDSQTQKL